MEDSLAKLHAKLDSIGSQLTKIDVIEQTMNTLVVENAALREEVKNKNKIIDELNEKVNRLDQSTRSNSLRIHGLPVTSNTPPPRSPT
jgi:predicted RNase H-like nuclease (RuvC/YqgF family)